MLDKEIEVGPDVRMGGGDDHTPNQLEPANLNTGITIAGKRACIPAGTVIGRNCRIDPNVTPADFGSLEVPSGGTLSRREVSSEETH